MFHNDTAVRSAAAAGGGGGGGGGGGWGWRGRKGKNQYGQRTFPGAAERGDPLWGNDDLCQGWKGRQGASGTKVCADND